MRACVLPGSLSALGSLLAPDLGISAASGLGKGSRGLACGAGPGDEWAGLLSFSSLWPLLADEPEASSELLGSTMWGEACGEEGSGKLPY